LIATFFLSPSGYAETIVLKNGIVAKGRIIKAEEKGIRVEYSEGRIVYHRREEILEVQREDDPALAEAEAARKKGDTAKAAEVLTRAIAAERVGWMAERYRLELMECQLAKTQFAAAVATYVEMMRANPESSRYGRMPLPIYGSEENTKALKHLERCLGEAGAPGLWMDMIRMLVGSVLAAEARTDEAEGYLHMLRTSHEDATLQFAKLLAAQIAIAQKKYREAAAALEKDLRTMPEGLKPRACYLLGVACANRGDAKEAAVAFLRVPVLYANDSAALQSECLYQGAVASEKAGLKEQAEALRRELSQKFPFSYRGRFIAEAARPDSK
jgi:tetratricopeptide (TPR) repeat protein